MNNEQLHRDLGRVEGKLEALTGQVSIMNARLDVALTYIEQQKGARKATIGIASAIATFVGFAAGLAGNWIGS